MKITGAMKQETRVEARAKQSGPYISCTKGQEMHLYFLCILRKKYAETVLGDLSQ